jgi:DNA-directed RNA polymerase beta subunit
MDQLLIWVFWAWDWVKPVVAFIATFGLTLAAVVAAAWAAFQWFGQKWIENKFAKGLEEYKAGQAQELEKLKHKINSAFDRITRLHVREFEVLPDLWGKLVEAKLWAGAYTSVMQRYARVEYLDDDALREFLDGTGFAEWQKREIMQASNKQDQYTKTSNRYRHADVGGKLREFDLSFSKNGIFLKSELKEMMRKMLDIIHHAVVEHNMNEEHNILPRIRSANEIFENEGETLFLKIENAVSDRLWESANKEL